MSVFALAFVLAGCLTCGLAFWALVPVLGLIQLPEIWLWAFVAVATFGAIVGGLVGAVRGLAEVGRLDQVRRKNADDFDYDS